MLGLLVGSADTDGTDDGGGDIEGESDDLVDFPAFDIDRF